MSGDPFAVLASPDSLSSDYFIGKLEVTEAQWQAVMGSDPTSFPSCGADCAVDRASWDDIAGPGGYLERLRGLLGEPKFRMPTEAERERATRGGTQTRFFFGGALDSPDTCGLPSDREYMWTCGGGSPHPVGMKKPNPLGLYDVHGNVDEWVERGREVRGAPVPDGQVRPRGGGLLDPRENLRSPFDAAEGRVGAPAGSRLRTCRPRRRCT